MQQKPKMHHLRGPHHAAGPISSLASSSAHPRDITTASVVLSTTSFVPTISSNLETIGSFSVALSERAMDPCHFQGPLERKPERTRRSADCCE